MPLDGALLPLSTSDHIYDACTRFIENLVEPFGPRIDQCIVTLQTDSQIAEVAFEHGGSEVQRADRSSPGEVSWAFFHCDDISLMHQHEITVCTAFVALQTYLLKTVSM